jgi:hypothetical protein
MNKIMTIGSAAVLALAVGAAAVTPANAQPFPWWYHHHHYNHWVGPGPAIGAGILGFAAGAALASSARDRDYGYYGDGPRFASNGDHIAACQDQYRSYDIRTDTYLGYDGDRHYCEL